MNSYYNENEPYVAQWLRNLIAAGHIAPGDVDDRSILDVAGDDLAGYAQCHFFAGIGGWSLALHLAGWPDDRPVWTGSCPCQPFSSAGKQVGGADDRHLWPAWFRLIGERRPDVVFGEQVEGSVGFGWIDRVFADLEAEGYACGAAVLGAHSISAPHIRQRLWWVANADGGIAGNGGLQPGGQYRQQPEDGESGGGLADADGTGQHRQWGQGLSANGNASFWNDPDGRSEASGVGLPEFTGLEGHTRNGNGGHQPGWNHEDTPRSTATAGGTCWLPCSDGKARRTQPGIFPLVDAGTVRNRVGKLRAAGNAIIPQVAAEFITAFMECQP